MENVIPLDVTWLTRFIPRQLAKVTAIVARRTSLAISNWFEKGRGGSGYWLAAGILLWGFRKLIRMGRRVDDVVYSESLVPGQVVTISHLHEDFLSVE